MACLNLDTFAYPSWWESASAVQVTLSPNGTLGTHDREDVEFLPQGLSISTTGILVPWARVGDVQKVT